MEALGRCRMRWGGGRWKSQNRKNVYLSSYVEEPLNSKVIKSFVPELRSCYVFFKFWDSYVLSLWTFDVLFTLSYIMAMVHPPGKRRHEGNDNKGSLNIFQRTGGTPSDSLVWHPGHTWGVRVSYLSVEILGSLNKFRDFFRMGTFIGSTHMKF